MHAPARFDARRSRRAGTACRTSSARGCKRKATTREIARRWVVLATGAVPQALIAAGVCERRTPSGVALRGYVHNPAMAGRITELEVRVAPAPEAGLRLDLSVPRRRVQHRRRRRPQPREGPDRPRDDAGREPARDRSTAFSRVYAPARELIAGGTLQARAERRAAALLARRRALFARPGCWSPAKPPAAPMRSPARASARRWRPACWPREAIAEGRAAASDDATVRRRYEARVAALKPRFDLYETRQPRQRPPLAGRPADLARAPQPAHPASA